MSEEAITVSLAHYNQLLKDSMKLAALEVSGVENWHGYDYAMDILTELENAPNE